MARIKRQGLDYFPLNTDFMQDRLVRRIMKREGDGSLATLLGALSMIYADKGYYVCVDDLLYEDLSACLYEQSAEDVKRILGLALEYGIFDAALFEQYAIFTSAEIQKQFLFSTKRRRKSAIDARYCLLDESTENDENSPLEAASVHSEGQHVTFNPQNVTSGTHSTAQHSTEKHSAAQKSKENPLLNSSPTVGTERTDDSSVQEEERIEEELLGSEGETNPHNTPAPVAPMTEAPACLPRKEWTNEAIDQLQPPQDGIKRNLEGLIFNLRQCHIPPKEQYAIIVKSNYGIIGHPLWRGFFTLRESHGKIKLPGRFLLSLCYKSSS